MSYCLLKEGKHITEEEKGKTKNINSYDNNNYTRNKIWQTFKPNTTEYENVKSTMKHGNAMRRKD